MLFMVFTPAEGRISWELDVGTTSEWKYEKMKALYRSDFKDLKLINITRCYLWFLHPPKDVSLGS